MVRNKVLADKTEFEYFLFIEFSRKLDQFYQDSKDTDLYCLWLGTHPLIAFFHPVGLEVCI